MLEPEFDPVADGERNKAALMVALWRFKRELDCLDMTNVRMSEKETAEVRETWAALVAGLKTNLRNAA
jgi:hypothetical protein